MIKHHQHTYLLYAQLWLLSDVNTPSAYGLENNKACNKYQANPLKGFIQADGTNSSIFYLRFVTHSS